MEAAEQGWSPLRVGLKPKIPGPWEPLGAPGSVLGVL